MKPKKTLMLDEFGQFIMNIIKKEEIETEIFKRLELLFTSLFCVLLSSSFVSSSTSGPPLPFTSLSCAFFPPPPPSPPPPPLSVLFLVFFLFFLFLLRSRARCILSLPVDPNFHFCSLHAVSSSSSNYFPLIFCRE